MNDPEPIPVVQDTREKRPLLFPATLDYRGRIHPVHIVKRTMPEGDYSLDIPEPAAIVERKGSLDEIRQNLLTTDNARFLRAITRLCDSCDHPILLLEATPSDLLLPTKDIPRPGPLVQLLCNLCAARGILLLLPGACHFPTKRRAVGELVLRLLLAHNPPT